MISQTTLDKIRQTYLKFSESMAKETLKWFRDQPAVTGVPLFNEGEVNLDSGTELDCLVGYNYFRTWPITKQTPEGEIDAQNLVVYINLEYLKTLGYTNDESYFVFDPSVDRFEIRGMRYKCEGHTQVAQLGSEPLWMLLTLQRDDLSTTDKPIRP